MSLKILAPSFFARLKRTVENVGSGGMLLNVGCGEGEYNRILAPLFKFSLGLDVNRNDIFLAGTKKTGSSFLLASGHGIPLKNRSFDKVICVDVIEHVENDGKLISEVSRVTKKGGTVVVSVPNRRFPFTYDPINALLGVFGRHVGIGIWGFGHLRLYDEHDLKHLLEKNGFEIENVEYLNHYLSGLCENYLSTIFHKFLKSSPGRTVKKDSNPPKLLSNVVKSVLAFDNKVFKNSKRSIGLLIRAKKVR